MLNYETLLGCVCFGWKWFQEIIFRKIGCLVGLENWIFRKSFSVDRKIVALTTEIHFRFYFHFKWFPELGMCKGRTRERKNARSRGVISHEAPFAIDTSRDRAVDRNLAKHRSRRSRSEIVPSITRSRRVLLGMSGFFWVLPLPSSFPTSFPNTRKYFSKNILKCNQTHENIFLSRK